MGAAQKVLETRQLREVEVVAGVLEEAEEEEVAALVVVALVVVGGE